MTRTTWLAALVMLLGYAVKAQPTGQYVQYQNVAGTTRSSIAWPGLKIEVVGYQSWVWAPGDYLGGTGGTFKRVASGAYVYDEDTVPALFPRWRAYWEFVVVNYDDYVRPEYYRYDSTSVVGHPRFYVYLDSSGKWFPGIPVEDDTQYTWPSDRSSNSVGQDYVDPTTGEHMCPPSRWYNNAAGLGVRWTYWPSGDGWTVEYNLRFECLPGDPGTGNNYDWRDGGGGDNWVKAYDIRISSWDGEDGTAAAGSVDDAFEEEIYNAVLAFQGDFAEWITDAELGWQRAMFQTGISKTPYLQQLQDYLSGAKNGVLKTAGGTAIQRLEDIDNNTDGLEPELIDIGLTLDGILSAVTADGTLDTGEFNGPEPGASYLGDNILPHLNETGWSFFQPVGFDYTTPPVWVIDVPVASWFSGSQFSSSGLEEVSFTIDTSIFAPMRTTLQTIWLAGVTLWSLGRIWGELRKT